MTSNPANLVPNAVDDRLPEIRLHRADVPRLECVEAAQDVQHGFLDQVARVQRTSCRRRKATMGKAPEARNRPLKQCFDGQPVSFSGLDDQLNGRLVAEKRVPAVGRDVRRSGLTVTGLSRRCGSLQSYGNSSHIP